MIKRIHIQNYKSLRDVDLELGPFNVLIGPNASGKSNFLSLLQLLNGFLAEGVQKALTEQGGGQAVLWQGDEVSSFSVQIECQLGKRRPLDYYLEVGFLETGVLGVKRERLFIPAEGGEESKIVIEMENGTGWIWNERTESENNLESEQGNPLLTASIYLRDYPTMRALSRFIRDWRFYDVHPARTWVIDDYFLGEHLFPSGSNLASVLRTLEQQKPGVFEEILVSLQRAIPSIETVETLLDDNNLVSFRVHEAPFRRFFPSYALSDGTLRLLAYLAVLKLDDPPPLICIEEPDRNLHPQLMLHLRDAFRSAAERTQIIVTTYNADFVNYLAPEEVITVNREEGESRFRPASTVEDLQDWLEDYRLGEIWKMRLMGGVQ